MISGQHLSAQNHALNTFVEVEILGIPADCMREKSKIVQRNSTNPIWDLTIRHRISFFDLAFLRIAVIDSQGSKCIAQRIIPLKSLNPGYRHVRLRTPQNSITNLATIFVFSRMEEEEFISVDNEPDMHVHPVHSLDVRIIFFSI